MSSSKRFEDKGGATLSRRALVGAAGVTAATARCRTGLRPAAARRAAQARRTAVHHHDAAARFRPERRAHRLLHRSRRPHGRSGFDALRQPNAAIQRLWTGALWSEGPAWNAQGRYLVWSDIPNNRQLRWIEDDGRVSVFRMPVEQQQRQHLRLPGPAALLRAPDAARRALRARRLGHRARRRLRRQAAQLAQRRRAASRRQLLVHRPAVRRPAL